MKDLVPIRPMSHACTICMRPGCTACTAPEFDITIEELLEALATGALDITPLLS